MHIPALSATLKNKPEADITSGLKNQPTYKNVQGEITLLETTGRRRTTGATTNILHIRC